LLQQGELGDCVQETLAGLPSLQQAVFVLHHIDEQEPEDVCNNLNISESNRRVLLHRARLRLFESVEHYQETGEC
jgi:RNA polymerase sigma-70 factor (ECF subfamily)